MIKKIPERKCMGCNAKKPKIELVRIVRSPEGEISLDTTGKKAGRGVYICNNIDCFSKARKAKRLEKSLETAIPEQVYDNIAELLKVKSNE